MSRTTKFVGFVPQGHAWLGTEHCLRDDERSCSNDHTGCLWNDGHNACMHPSEPRPERYDSPLKKIERPTK